MGGVGGRGAGGGFRELLPLTRFRLDLEFRSSKIPALEASPALPLSGGNGLVGSPTWYCFPVSCLFYLLWFLRFPSLILLNSILLSNWRYWASDLLLFLCFRCTCQSHLPKARGFDPRVLNGPGRNCHYFPSW